MVRRTGHPG